MSMYTNDNINDMSTLGSENNDNKPLLYSGDVQL